VTSLYSTVFSIPAPLLGAFLIVDISCSLCAVYFVAFPIAVLLICSYPFQEGSADAVAYLPDGWGFFFFLLLLLVFFFFFLVRLI
jgi:hypothetical protein